MLKLSNEEDHVFFHSAVEIGLYLKTKREELELTLSQAALDVKISPDFLKAIEAGDFNKFPGQVYAIGFVRTYASYLGLDANFVVRSLKLCTDFYQGYHEKISQIPIPLEGPETKRNVGISIILLSAFIFFISYFISRSAP